MTNTGNSDNDSLAEELRRLVSALDAAGNIELGSSMDELLQTIVEAAARIFGAAAASILLVDEAEEVLVFKVAYGASDKELIGMRIPLNQGIAGYVAMSGQPIAISDVAQDARFNRDFARSTGYVPRSILATPLLAGERVLGVMEVLDKINAPSFGMQDMELLGLFARQAALAIDQAQKIENIGQAMVDSLKRLAVEGSRQEFTSMLSAMEGHAQADSKESLSRLVATLIEFGRMGEAEREMALDILTAVARYSREQHRLSGGVMWK